MGAAIVGSVHALASGCWALGGTWLAETVGDVGRQFSGQPGAGLLLLAVAAAKLAMAWGPVLTQRWVGRSGRFARRLVLLGGAVLAAYGLILTSVGLIALTGVLGEVTDPVSLRGHALLWDPLFALWGTMLLLGVRASRGGALVSEPTAATT